LQARSSGRFNTARPFVLIPALVAALFADPNLGRMVANTFVFGAIALVVSFVLGVPLAWPAERSDLPGRAFIWTLMLASLVIPGSDGGNAGGRGHRALKRKARGALGRSASFHE
jgi:ABC-type Fe3+ transport system permease subunit